MYKLTCGNPHSKDEGFEGASFSRFVLPFAYCLSEDSPNRRASTDYVFLPEPDHPPSLLARKKYLTQESTNVLFDRAQRFFLG
jgi:hypothetical protein